jgi:hypothetical protein
VQRRDQLARVAPAHLEDELQRQERFPEFARWLQLTISAGQLDFAWRSSIRRRMRRT